MATPHNIPQLIGKKLQETASTEEEAELEAWAGAASENRALLNRLLDEPTLFADVKNFDALWGEAAGDERYQRMEQEIIAQTDGGLTSDQLHRGPETSIVSLEPRSRRDPGSWRVLTTRWRARVARALIAAVFLSLLSIGYYFWRGGNETNAPLTAEMIVPGGNRATLTLADGRTIDLDEAQTGIVIGDENITYADGSSLELSHLEGGRGVTETTELLALTTPKGGTYQVTLPDGSKVWLNAGSTFKYPSRFSGSERVVELSGEAYFDIQPMQGTRHGTGGTRNTRAPADNTNGSRYNTDGARVARVPFKVRTANQVVNVLGTQFNISAYADEAETKTTLVEGRVRVHGEGVGARFTAPDNAGVTLSPNQQAISNGSQLSVTEVDVEDFTAWKDGYFQFSSERLGSIMAKLARWYDVEVVFQDEALKDETFFGGISRYEHIGEVLGMLETTEVAAFSVEGRRVTIQRKR